MASEGSKAASVVGIFTLTLFLSTLFIGLRVYSRAFVLKSFGLDDGFIVLTWFIGLTYNIFVFISVGYGYGQHRYFLSAAEYIQVVKYFVLCQPFAVLAFVPSKASVAIFLARVFPDRRLHLFLWLLIGFNTAVLVALATIQLAQCQPASKQWDPSIPGHCIEPAVITNTAISSGTLGAATDFILALTPWYYIRRLQMARREKAAIGTAMSLGVIAGVFAIVKTYYCTTLSSRTDFAYDTVQLNFWVVAELCAINVAASIPMLHPLLKWLPFRRQKQSSSGSAGTGATGRRSRPTPLGWASRFLKDSDETSLVGSHGTDRGPIWVEERIEVRSYPSQLSGESSSRITIGDEQLPHR